MKQIKHFPPDYLLAPTHPVSITVCGAGGTGSQVITGLARIDFALRALGHPGFHVRVFDGDEVSSANIGRQLFSEAEIGENKANIIVSRANRFFGRRWESRPHHMEEGRFNPYADATNFLITCVDSVAARKQCLDLFTMSVSERKAHPHLQQFYWMDYGNAKSTGQVVLGTVKGINQPAGNTYDTLRQLPNVFELYPWFKDQADEDNEPSCSVMEALTRQDLMINTILANFGTDMLFRFFREGGLTHQGVFVNLPEVFTTKIPLKIKNDGSTSRKKQIVGAELA